MQELGPEDERHVGHSHRGPGVAGIRFLHRIDGEEPDRVDAAALEIGGGALRLVALFGRPHGSTGLCGSLSDLAARFARRHHVPPEGSDYTPSKEGTVSVTESVVTVKGSPIRSLQKFIDAELTPEQKEKALKEVPAEYAERLRTPVIVTETIPVEIINRYTEGAARAKGEPLEQFARRVGRAGASEAIQGIYRSFALVLTPT